MRLLRRLLVLLFVPLALVALLWGSLALWIDGPAVRQLAAGMAVSYGLAGLVVLLRVRPWWRAALGIALLVGGVVAWQESIPASNDRQWLPDVAALPTATVVGDQVTVRNVRDFVYHSSDSDFTAHWETRTYDLARLRGVDLFFSFWGPTDVAHTIMSWDFGDGQHLAISIETRKEVGESYSAVRGFFRQYELYYVVAEERDVIGVRAQQRGERLWLYRLQMPPAVARALLLDYLEEINRLAVKPRWYNAFAHNCTTSIRLHAMRVMPVQPWSWQMLLNGHLEELLYRRGAFDNGLPFAELRARSEVTDAARAAGDADDFSARIRVGLPKEE
ncbi:MAG: DUF4105 domain-containing protein [Deltaproteobacteria bacterium]|nr:DUF4105 domain-containing protein [Deltaproteobacteria bacterium]